MPKRVRPSEYGRQFSSLDPTLFPNYSRYPSDKEGLTTYESMVHAGPVVANRFDKGLKAPTSVKDYFLATHSYHDPSRFSDPLAQNSQNPADPSDSFNRRLEIAAIRPDAFDYTYYSISPNYYDYFIEYRGKKKLPKLFSKLSAGDLPIRGDIGAHPGKPNFSILNQLDIENEVARRDRGRGYQIIIDRSLAPVPWLYSPPSPFSLNFLTAWNKGQTPMTYFNPTNNSMSDFFANCQTPLRSVASTKPRVPSGCLKGGRFGYSVKLISGDYIWAEHPIGGGGIRGKIENLSR